MTEILAVSKSGINVLTETNPNNYIFHSLYNTFKIVYQGKTNVTLVNGTVHYQFPHNSPLASTSCILIFVQFPDGKVTLVTGLGSRGNSTKAWVNLQTGSGNALDGFYFDNTNIYFENLGGISTYTFSIVWYIFEASL